MPPRGRGRGRGIPPGRQDQPPPGQQQQQRPPPELQQHAAPPPQREPIPQQFSPPVQEQRRQKTTYTKVDNPEEVLSIELKHKAIIEPDLPRDPGAGKMGRKIKLLANNYPVTLPDGYVYHYDIEVDNVRQGPPSDSGVKGEAVKESKKYRCINTRRNREVINYMLKTCAIFKGKLAAYDGKKNMYTRKPLDIPRKIAIPVDLPDECPGDPNDPRGPRRDLFEVTIQPVQKKETNSCAISLESLHSLFEGKSSTVSQEAVMAIETILRSTPCMQFVPVGRSFFYPPAPEDLHPLGGGREIWFGYHQSLRLGQWSPMVNLDITATTFYQSGPVLYYLAEFLNCRVDDLKTKRLNDAEIKRIGKELKMLRVETTHLKTYKRKYRVLGLTREPANKLEFEHLDRATNRTVKSTVAAYFANHHKRPLHFPNLPCIQGNPKEKKIYLPIEVCDMVEGQHCKKKLEERQNAEMIKFTARPPDRRFKEITNIRRDANFDKDEYLREFGIKVARDPVDLDGRVIDAPNVRYLNDKKIKPRDGQWDMRGTKYFRGAEIGAWVLLSFSNPRFCPQQALEKFARLLCEIGKEQGINIQRPALIEMVNQRANIPQLLTQMKGKYQADLAVCVVPTSNKTIYGEVKQAAETVIGLKTQCIKDDNVVKKCNPPLVSNLCQKVNAKMGGINNSLTPGETPAIMKRPVIIIGADVTHPSPSQDIKPSIAAAVGSLDAHPSRYAVTIRAQVNIDDKKQAIEYILDLSGMVVDLLKAFYKSTKGKKPEKIIFFRDGVSEGQFAVVKDHEVKAIREACRTLSPDYQPGVTFVVVQKRHHTRFMTQDRRDGSGKMGNIPPGTAVDTKVTHPLNFDFFLCSHFGLQGTSRPGHYTVIEDDNEFTQDELQKLAYYLCHTYVRCTKSISIPAPVAYAHLAAFRARQHLVTQYDESSASSDNTVRSGGSERTTLPQIVIDAIKVKEDLKDTMYFV